jgi:uncharacterized NAD(P)/FAD-binding protein YdhS
MPSPSRIAILGGGFSGILVLWHLTRQTRRPLHIRLYADAATLGRGLAYATPDPCHLLNVPAARMGALPDQHAHFHAWAQRAPDQWRDLAPAYADLAVTEDTFMPRQVYGAYLQGFLREACASSTHSIELVFDAATGLTDSGGVISADETWAAGTIVLAIGPMLAQPFALPRHPGALATPWGRACADFWTWYGQQAWTPDSRIALLGTGLTAVDMVMSLAARSFPGQIIALSRHGDWPAAHDPDARPMPWPSDLRPTTAAALRQAFDTALTAAGDNWRGVIDGCRPAINTLWDTLSDSEKKLFFKESFSWWNVRRHRMPHSSAATLANLAATGRLVTRAAPVAGVRSGTDTDFVVNLMSGDDLPVDGVISTLGFGFDVRQATAPLLRSAVQQGFVQPGPAGLGVAVTDDYTAFQGQDWRLLTLGQSLFGARFETTAVPELRQQAAEVAARIV